jgi:ABC-2 type transport system permease protein
MTNPFQTPFAAVFSNEVLLNIKRVAPYVLMVFFASNAVLWWGWGPAVERGWATNSDFYIQRNFSGFAIILGLPIFTGIIMGDPVIRDFRLGVHPLIFSKPIGRGAYLLAKFFGNFFVLICCQSAFAITFFLLQWVPFSGMVTQPVRIVPYFKHFVFIVVISHLGLAAIYFLVGTLSRSAKVVFGLAAFFYPIYIALALLFRNLPKPFRVFIAPFGLEMSPVAGNPWQLSAGFLNSLVTSYSLTAYANRASVIVWSTLLLLIVYWRFRIEWQEGTSDSLTKLTLSDEPDRVAYSVPTIYSPDSPLDTTPIRERIKLPKVTSIQGAVATRFKLLAAIGVEFRLLRAERGLIVLIPLSILLSFLSVPFSRIAPEISSSVTSATNTANMLLLFLTCVIVFYMGESMHRDRELKIEPVVWSTPAPNSVLLLSKYFTLTLLALALVIVGSLTTIATQLLRGQTPVDISAYLIINGILVVPGIVFVTALTVVLNVLLRNKYLTYVVSFGTGAGLIYLYNIGYNHWLYNPLLVRTWTYSDLTSGTILASRLYCLGLAAILLMLAPVCFERRSK